MTDNPRLTEFSKELDHVLLGFDGYHNSMEMHRSFYNLSAFYQRKGGNAYDDNYLSVNFLKVFADKNVDYISPLPTIECLPTGNDETAREAADKREKLIAFTYDFNSMEQKQADMAWDSTVMSAAILLQKFDLKKRCVKYERVDPRFAFWEYADDNSDKVIAFWIIYPMSQRAAQKRFKLNGVIGAGPIDIAEYAYFRNYLNDDTESVMFAQRFDNEFREAWVGDRNIEPRHKHGLDDIPVDVVMPWLDGELQRRGDFYLRPLISPQAELNLTIRRKSNVVKRHGHPAIWGRGILSNQIGEVKTQMSGTGGFVGLKGNGELGILQPNDTTMIDTHIDRIIDTMMKLSGFGPASFGESVGANTSGDALNMYFTPTTRTIARQQIYWRAFYKSVNAKTLKLYEKFLKPGESKRLIGYLPSGRFSGVKPDERGEDKAAYQTAGFDMEVTRDDIGGNYNTLVEFDEATPKDETAMKELLIAAVQNKLLSKYTAISQWGIKSPHDELDKIRNEESDPALNPEGTSTLLDSVTGFNQSMAPAAAGAAPAAAPTTPGVTGNGY